MHRQAQRKSPRFPVVAQRKHAGRQSLKSECSNLKRIIFFIYISKKIDTKGATCTTGGKMGVGIAKKYGPLGACCNS